MIFDISKINTFINENILVSPNVVRIDSHQIIKNKEKLIPKKIFYSQKKKNK